MTRPSGATRSRCGAASTPRSQASALFAQFDEAAGAKNYAEAIARYEQIPPTSIYKRRAKPRYDEARTLLSPSTWPPPTRRATAGKCAEVRTEVAEVMRLEPRNLHGEEMVRLCQADGKRRRWPSP